MVRMDKEHRRTGCSVAVIVTVGAVAVIAFPWLLIPVAIFEQAGYGSGNVQELSRTVGMFEPLDWLLESQATYSLNDPLTPHRTNRPVGPHRSANR